MESPRMMSTSAKSFGKLRIAWVASIANSREDLARIGRREVHHSGTSDIETESGHYTTTVHYQR